MNRRGTRCKASATEYWCAREWIDPARDHSEPVGQGFGGSTLACHADLGWGPLPWPYGVGDADLV